MNRANVWVCFTKIILETKITGHIILMATERKEPKLSLKIEEHPDKRLPNFIQLRIILIDKYFFLYPL